MVTDLCSLPSVHQFGEPPHGTLEAVVETVQFSIVCFTLPFYCFVIYSLIDAQLRGVKELSTPFFKLCVTTAVIDICTLLNNYLGSKIPKWGWGTRVYLFLDGYYAHIYFYFAWTSGICQAMCVTVSATNRLSAIIFPNKHYQIWNSKRLRAAYVIQFLPGMLVGCATFFSGTQLYRNTSNGVVPKFKNESFIFYLFLTAGTFMTFVCLYLIFAYCYLIFVLRKNGNAIKGANFQKSKNQSKKKEMKLFIMSSITVAIQMCALCLLICNSMEIFAISLDTFYLLYNVICDLYAGINPYLLWILSDSLRKHIFTRIRRKTIKKATSSPSVVTMNQT